MDERKMGTTSGCENSVVDLYIERERMPWYPRFIVTISILLLMTGFLILPPTFPSIQDMALNTDPNVALIVSLVFILISASTAFTLAILTTSSLFHFDVVFIPHFLVAILGLLNVVYHIGIQQHLEFNKRVIAGLTVALLSVSVFGIAAVLAYSRLHVVRKRDMIEHQGGLVNSSATRSQRQRQHFDAEKGHSPTSSTSSTCPSFKIHWPCSDTMKTTATSPNKTPFSLRDLQWKSRSRFPVRRSSIRRAGISAPIPCDPLRLPTPFFAERPGRMPPTLIERAIPEITVEDMDAVDSENNSLQQSIPIHYQEGNPSYYPYNGPLSARLASGSEELRFDRPYADTSSSISSAAATTATELKSLTTPRPRDSAELREVPVTMPQPPPAVFDAYMFDDARKENGRPNVAGKDGPQNAQMSGALKTHHVPHINDGAKVRLVQIKGDS